MCNIQHVCNSAQLSMLCFLNTVRCKIGQTQRQQLLKYKRVTTKNHHNSELLLLLIVCVSTSGLEQKVNSLAQLKVKGLVVGPIHVAPPDEAVNLSFEEISPEAGNLDQFKGFIQAAHKKGQGDSLLQKQLMMFYVPYQWESC